MKTFGSHQNFKYINNNIWNYFTIIFNENSKFIYFFPFYAVWVLIIISIIRCFQLWKQKKKKSIKFKYIIKMVHESFLGEINLPINYSARFQYYSRVYLVTLLHYSFLYIWVDLKLFPDGTVWILTDASYAQIILFKVDC